MGLSATYEQYLKSVHDKMLIKYKVKNAAQEQTNAKKLEKYLNILKLTTNNKNSKHLIQSEFDQAFQEEVLNIVKLYKLGPLFNLTHKQGQQYTAGTRADDIFELQLQQAINTLSTETMGNGEIAALTGQSQYNISLEKEISETARNIIQGMVNQSKTVAKNLETNNYTRPVARSGKVDMQVGILPLTSQLSPMWQDFFNLISQKSFSLKNYTQRTIHFGTSDPYKAFIGPLQSIGYSQAWAERLFIYSVQNYKTNSSESAQHLYHLRFIYELSGAGLRDIETGAGDIVDFIIYNNPSATGEIKVDSVAYLISQELNKNKVKDRAIYRGISMSAKKL